MSSSLPCKDCLSGSLHEEHPTGIVSTLHALPTYIAEPQDTPKGIVVIHCDAFGWDLPNARTLADRYAKRTGCRVYVPDFLNGNAFPNDVLDTMEFLMTPQPSWGATLYKVFSVMRVLYVAPPFFIKNRMSVVKPRTMKWFKALRATEAKDLPVGIAGFCLGGLYTFDLAKDEERVDGKPLIDCGFTAHPSFLTVPKDGDEAKIPVSVIVGDVDNQLKGEKAPNLKAALEKNPVEHEMNILPGAKHGFAVRWNTKDEKENENGHRSEDQAVAWFHKHMKL